MEFEIFIFPSGGAEITINGEYMLASAAPCGIAAVADTAAALAGLLKKGGSYTVCFDGGEVFQTLILSLNDGRLIITAEENERGKAIQAFEAHAETLAAAKAFASAAEAAVKKLSCDKTLKPYIEELNASLALIISAVKFE